MNFKMKLFLKILFFQFAIFYTNISEAKVFVFDNVVSEMNFSINVVNTKSESTIILENDFGIICKSGSDLVAYRSLVLAVKATAAEGGVAELSSLNPTHYLTRSKTQMQVLVNDIRINGIKDAIEYVEFNGQKYIVGGNHRYFAAHKLGIKNVPVKQVELPFAGYKTPTDLILEGSMPGYWRYIK
jgi:hypothetical protein